MVLCWWFCVLFCVLGCFFFFKQKTAYEMRISDWSSDVCSSDLHPGIRVNVRPRLLYGRGEAERFDAEIQLHAGYVSGMSAQYLCGREMTLVATPGLLQRHPVRCVDDLDGLPLLKRAQRGYGWDEWRADVADRKSTRLNSSH